MGSWRILLLLAFVATFLQTGWSGISQKEEVPAGVDCKESSNVLRIGNQTIPAVLARCYLEASPEMLEEVGDLDTISEKFNATRFQLPRLSRIEDFSSFFKSLRLVVRVASSRGRKILPTFCLHKNDSAPLGYCPTKWKEPDSRSGIWKAERSPFEKNILEIRWPEREDPRDLYISVLRDTDQHRVVWLLVGLVLMPLADTLSKIVVLYYGVGMSVGVLLVIGILVFQLMKLLPLTRGSSARVVFAGAVMGMGGILVTWLSGLASETAEYFGFGDQFINPLVYLALLIIIGIGAAMGFWFVRKLVVLPSGELDPTTIVFVRWTLWVFAAALLIMSSADAILGTLALCTGVFLTTLVSYAPSLGRRALQASTRRRGTADALDEADYPGTPVREASRVQGDGSSEIRNAQVLKQTFVSSFHHINGRRLMTPQAVASVSKEATRAALADLVKSPAFGQWASRNLNRVVIMPESKRQPREYAEISATAWMEEGPYEEGD